MTPSKIEEAEIRRFIKKSMFYRLEELKQLQGGKANENKT